MEYDRVHLVHINKLWTYMYMGVSRLHIVETIYEFPISQKSANLHLFMLCVSMQNINIVNIFPQNK